MSRSFNERSIPNGRGRLGDKKAKRRSHRRARDVMDIEDIKTVKYRYRQETLDRETRQRDIGDI